jgi:hypothetical protein
MKVYIYIIANTLSPEVKKMNDNDKIENKENLGHGIKGEVSNDADNLKNDKIVKRSDK